MWCLRDCVCRVCLSDMGVWCVYMCGVYTVMGGDGCMGDCGVISEVGIGCGGGCSVCVWYMCVG